jgi:hypothetical protein
MHKRAYMHPYSHDVGRILEDIGREGGARARGRWDWGALRLKPGKKNKRAYMHLCTILNAVGRILEDIRREGGARTRGWWDWKALRWKPSQKDKRTYIHLYTLLDPVAIRFFTTDSAITPKP